MRKLAYRYLKNIFFANSLSYLVFFVTSRCNADCLFCLNKDFSSGIKGNTKDNISELTSEEIKRIAFNMKGLPHLLISGGEPFMRSDLAEIVGSFYRYSGTRLVTIPTNGYYFEAIETVVKKILLECRDINLRIVFSVNGDSSAHDQVKRLSGSFDNFRKANSRLNRLKSKHPNLSLLSGTVITKEFKKCMPELIEFFKNETPLDGYALSCIRGKRASREHLSPSEQKLWNDFISSQEAKINRKSFLDIYADFVLKRSCNIIDRSLHAKQAIVSCLAGIKFIVLKEDGSVFPCETETGSNMGNIRDFQYDINKLLAGPCSQKVISQIKRANCYCDWTCAMNINLINSRMQHFGILAETLSSYLKKKRPV